MSTTIGGIRIVDMPDIGTVTDDSSVVGEHSGSGRFQAPALRTYIQSSLRKFKINVKDYGAIGDGVADDTAACQAAINYGLANGGDVYFPTGNYKITGTGLLINQTITDYGLHRVNLSGDGKGNTRLTFSGTGTCLTYHATTTGAGIIGLFTIADLQIVGPGSTQTGLTINIASYVSLRDVLIMNFATGLQIIDTVSATVQGVAFFSNGTAMTAYYNVQTPPNALTFIGCTFGSSTNYGAVVTGAAALAIYGGSIESNGTPSGGGGIELINCGTDGGVGALFSGVYFENNATVADINISHGAAAGIDCVYNVIGCMFNRGSGAATQIVTNNILLASSSGVAGAILNVQGCGFRGYAPYTPSASRRYIQVNAGGNTRVNVTAFGNLYASSVERPTFNGPAVTQDAVATAWVRFNGAGAAGPITPQQAFNATVNKTSTGIYVVSFTTAMATAINTYAIAMIGAAGFAIVASETASSVTVNTFNTSAAAVDTQLSVVVFGGGNIV